VLPQWRGEGEHLDPISRAHGGHKKTLPSDSVEEIESTAVEGKRRCTGSKQVSTSRFDHGESIDMRATKLKHAMGVNNYM